MRPGTLAQALAVFAGEPTDVVDQVRKLLTSDATTGAVITPPDALNDAPVAWFYGPHYQCRSFDSLPAYVRASSDSLWYVRPASLPKGIDLVRDLLRAVPRVSEVSRLSGTHRTLAYRELRDRARRGVCPCCNRTLKETTQGAG